MPRGPRISFPHAVFHVINRFVDRHPFFKTNRDYQLFLSIYFETAETFGIWTYAYDLVPNHFHIVLETPSGDISRFLQRFLTRVVQRLNQHHQRTGHLLQGRTKTLLVQTDVYFETVLGYALLNRVRAGLAKSVFSDKYNSVGEMLARGKSRLARGPLWGYLFGRVFDERNIEEERIICRRWLAGLDVDANRKMFDAGHHGSFLSTEKYRRKVLKKLERRRLIGTSRYRRKTDRYKKKWTWPEIRTSAEKVVRNGKWKGLWRNEETAIRHISRYVASVGASWPYHQIREAEGDRGTSHSRYAMTVFDIRRNRPKRRLADAGIRLCLQTDKLTE